MKFLGGFFTLLIFMVSCRPARNLQESRPPVTQTHAKSDTTTAAQTFTDKVDTVSFNKNIYNKILSKKIRFTTFNAKVKLGYNGSQGNGEATAYIRLQKDSIMWLSLRGPFGIEGFRIVITRDSVTVMDLLKKNLQSKKIDFLQQVTGIPFDLSTLQDLIIGNAVFVDSNIVSTQRTANEISLLMKGKIFKNLLSVDTSDYSILRSHLSNTGITENLNCEIRYAGYRSGTERNFSTDRNISIDGSQQSKMNVRLEFKEYEFNQPVTFPFNVPRNYKRM